LLQYDKSLGEYLKNKGRHINSEESELWAQVVDGVSKININEKDKSDYFIKNKTAQSMIPPKPSNSSIQFSTTILEQTVGRQIVVDKKTFSKLKKGQIEPENKLDLHGMNFRKAHKEVLSFIMESNRKNSRLVLIITGKGQIDKKERDFFLENNSGTLKKALPGWLSVDPLKNLILNFTLAHNNHGGEGAYYVYLKRNRPYKT